MNKLRFVLALGGLAYCLCVLALPAALPALWARTSSRAFSGPALATPDGRAILVGNSLTKLSAEGQVVWGKIFDVKNPAQPGRIGAWLNGDGGCLAATSVRVRATLMK
jgi:hypothetical protein